MSGKLAGTEGATLFKIVTVSRKLPTPDGRDASGGQAWQSNRNRVRQYSQIFTLPCVSQHKIAEAQNTAKKKFECLQWSRDALQKNRIKLKRRNMGQETHVI